MKFEMRENRCHLMVSCTQLPKLCNTFLRKFYVRTKNFSALRAFRRAFVKCNCALGWHCVQSVRQRLQQSAIGMSQQPLHANNHCGRSLREGDKHLRFAKGRGCQRCEGKMESYVTFDIFVGAPRRTGRALRLRQRKRSDRDIQ